MKTFTRHLKPRKVERDGFTFDSAAEARRYGELRLRAMLHAKHPDRVHNLEVHPKVPLIVQGNKTGRASKIGRGYIVLDFAYDVVEDGAFRRIYEDVKAIWTREAKLRIALAEAVNEIKIHIIDGAST